MHCCQPSCPSSAGYFGPGPRTPSGSAAPTSRCRKKVWQYGGGGQAAIQFENVFDQSKIKFTLRNSVILRRYTFETMAGGVALFDHNNDSLLDIFFANGAAISSLEKIDLAGA